ncbi:hypothetical protein OG785_11330 [Streptomyces sp. NBC_00006]|uniref:hypothetical protein n=1 Tax=unclassified Streptomyces TaxID=2593676 RepID=UPI00225A05DD|nr:MULTISPECIES: hypothetical protein [unclassified Streptomyces]MCX5531150.1 hypothetical protein [Streptomyces sp. NBC_00006]
MFEYELHQIRSAELIEAAERYRLARFARTQAKARRAERRAQRQDAEGPVTSGHSRRRRAPRTA